MNGIDHAQALTHDINRLLPLLEKQGINVSGLWDWVELLIALS